MVVPIKLSEDARNNLGIATCTLCAVLCFAGVCIIGLGIYIQISINDRLILLESFNSGVLPNFLVSIGTFVLLLNGACAKIALDCSYAESNEKYRLAMVPVMAVIFLISIIVLSGSILCFTHRSSIEKGLHDGLLDAMQRYKYSKPVKVAMDKLQMKTRCCGSKLYDDWFFVPWVNVKYMHPRNPYIKRVFNKKTKIKVFSVPFSCCSVHTKGPCVHQEVLRFRKYRNYKSITIYKKGCKAKLMDEMENKILVPVGAFVQAVFIAHLIVLILLRYIQTSVQDAFLEGDPAGPGKGYVLPVACFNSLRAGDPDEMVRRGALQKMRGQKVPGEGEAVDVEGGGDTGDDDTDDVDSIHEGGEGGGGKSKDKKHKHKDGKSKDKKKSKSKSDKKSKSKKSKSDKKKKDKKKDKKKGKKH